MADNELDIRHSHDSTPSPRAPSSLGRDTYRRASLALRADVTWQLLDHKDAASLAHARQATAEICRQDPRATLEHDLDWGLGNAADGSVDLSVWLCRCGEEIVGYAPLIVAPSRLRPSIGERAITSWRVLRHTLVGCPLFKTAVRDREGPLTMGFLEAISRSMPDRGVIFLLGGRADSTLFELLVEHRRSLAFSIAGYGPAYQRRLIDLPSSFDDYVASLGKKTRRNLRSYERKLKQAAEKEIRIVSYTQREEVAPFLDAAIPLSQKTYQWTDIGIGLHDRTGLARQLRVAAERGWMHCYILFHGDAPIAFQVGYRYGDCYFAHDTGYDPSWAAYWPGNYMDMAIVRDQIEQHPDIRWVDFLYGDTFNKQRFSNVSRLERNFYLLPRTARGLGIYGSLRSASIVSEVTGQALDRFGLKETLRRVLRKS